MEAPRSEYQANFVKTSSEVELLFKLEVGRRYRSVAARWNSRSNIEYLKFDIFISNDQLYIISDPSIEQRGGEEMSSWTELASQYLPFVTSSLTFDPYSELIYSTSIGQGYLQSNHISSRLGLNNKYSSFKLYQNQVNQLSIINSNQLLSIGDNKISLTNQRSLPIWSLQ